MDIEIKSIPVHADQRGVIAELLTAGDIKIHNGLFGHLFFVTFNNNKAIRGNHYHKETHEYYLLISGRIKVILFDIKSKEKRTIILSSQKNKTSWLRIGPNIAHTCYCISPQASMVGYFSNTYDKTDTIKYILVRKK